MPGIARVRASRIILSLALLGVLVGTTTAVVLAVTSNPGPFTGCLANSTNRGSSTTKGQIYNISTAGSPSSPCLAADTQVTFSNGQSSTDAYSANGVQVSKPLSGDATAEIALPAGSYAATVHFLVVNTNQVPANVGCEVHLVGGSTTVISGELIQVPAADLGTAVSNSATLPFGVTVGNGSSLVLDCDGDFSYDIVAVKVGNLHTIP